MARQDQNTRVIELGVANVNINARDQGLAIAALAQESARARVAASAPTALTDSSTGTAGAALVAVPLGADAVHDGGSHVPKAGFDTTMGLVEDAHEELLAKTNELIVLIAGSTYPTVAASAGAAADNTIAEIAALTGATNNLVPRADANAQIVIARNNQASIAGAVNVCAVALGLATLPDNSGGAFSKTATEFGIVDAAATGTALATAGDATITLASANAALTALKNNISTLAETINEMRGALAIGPFVIATSNPQTRFVTADTTV
jgi:hypothetical protein